MENAACNLCFKNDKLTPIYWPEKTRRNAVVHVCDFCGLVQTLPRDKRGDGITRVSYGADFGNVRYGKAFSAQRALDFIDRHCGLSFERVLDVGAGKLSFVKALLKDCDPYVMAIEPDSSLIRRVPENVVIDTCTIEDFEPNGSYDLIHCSHTLEHLASPTFVLSKLRHMLSSTGVLYIEVPDFATIRSEDILEEWFIDKHLYHFSVSSLVRLLVRAGLYVIHIDSSDGENIRLIAEIGPSNLSTAPSESDWIKQSILEYKHTQANNRALLAQAIVHINEAPGKVVIWGAGRIFDLMLHLGLDKEQVFVIDTYLPKRDDIEVYAPHQGNKVPTPNYVIIASRTYCKEIEKQARSVFPFSRIVNWRNFGSARS